MNIGEWIKVIWAAVGAVISWLFGGFAVFVAVVVGLMVIDYITGVIAGAINKELSSKTGAKGILKKLLILIVIVAAGLLDYLLKTYVDPQFAVCLAAVCFFYAANELLSILENLGRAGVPFPDKLKDIIAVLNKRSLPAVKNLDSGDYPEQGGT